MVSPIPYLGLNGTELANANRTLVYVNKLLDDRFAAPRTGSDIANPAHLLCYCSVTSDVDYISPQADMADWWDGSNPASAEFLGLYAFSIVLSPVAKRSVSERNTGASIGSLHASARTIAVTGYLYATTPRGMVFGEDWLQQQLAGSSGCSDDILTLLRSCNTEDFADLHQIGLVDGPQYSQVGTIPDCYQEQVFFQLVAGWPYLIGASQVLTPATVITSGMANKVCGTITGAFGKTTAGKLTIVAGSSAVTGLTIYAEPCAGFTDTFCLAPKERILTSDLQWIPCGELNVGDELFAFEETARPENVNQTWANRRWAKSIVTRSERALKETVLVRLSNGDAVECSADHPWLANRSKHHPKQWVKAADLMKGPHFVSRVFDPWDIETSYEAGWLAGIMDGEGCLTIEGTTTRLSISQNVGPILDLIDERLRAFKFNPTGVRQTSGTMQLHMSGGFREVLRALGSLRPDRLLRNFRKVPWEKFNHYSAKAPQNQKTQVVAVEPLGLREVQSIATSTRTYIGEGYLMHNSDTFDPYLSGSGTVVSLEVGTLPAGSTLVYDGITHTATLSDGSGVIGGLDVLTPSLGSVFAWPEVTNGAVMCLCVVAGTVNAGTTIKVESADRSL